MIKFDECGKYEGGTKVQGAFSLFEIACLNLASIDCKHTGRKVSKNFIYSKMMWGKPNYDTGYVGELAAVNII